MKKTFFTKKTKLEINSVKNDFFQKLTSQELKEIKGGQTFPSVISIDSFDFTDWGRN